MRRRRPPAPLPDPEPLVVPDPWPDEPVPERLLRFDPGDWPAGPGGNVFGRWVAWSNARVAWENRPGHHSDFGPPNEAHRFVMVNQPKGTT